MIFFKSQLADAAENPKRRWQIAKNMLHCNDTDRVLSDAECTNLCQTLSAYFLDKIVNIKLSIMHKVQLLLDNSTFNVCTPAHSGTLLDNIHPASADEVYHIISSITNKSCRLDFIPTSLIKSCSGIFSHLIANLANLSFQEGCFPPYLNKL